MRNIAPRGLRTLPVITASRPETAGCGHLGAAAGLTGSKCPKLESVFNVPLRPSLGDRRGFKSVRNRRWRHCGRGSLRQYLSAGTGHVPAPHAAARGLLEGAPTQSSSPSCCSSSTTGCSLTLATSQPPWPGSRAAPLRPCGTPRRLRPVQFPPWHQRRRGSLQPGRTVTRHRPRGQRPRRLRLSPGNAVLTCGTPVTAGREARRPSPGWSAAAIR
jgi:hypothetical protein